MRYINSKNTRKLSKDIPKFTSEGYSSPKAFLPSLTQYNFQAVQVYPVNQLTYPWTHKTIQLSTTLNLSYLPKVNQENSSNPCGRKTVEEEEVSQAHKTDSGIRENPETDKTLQTHSSLPSSRTSKRTMHSEQEQIAGNLNGLWINLLLQYITPVMLVVSGKSPSQNYNRYKRYSNIAIKIKMYVSRTTFIWMH